MKPSKLRQPTSQECSSNTIIDVGDCHAMAMWSPQIGGYAGAMLVARDGDCVVAWIWFPTLDGDSVELHICDLDQFSRVLAEVSQFLKASAGKKPTHD